MHLKLRQSGWARDWRRSPLENPAVLTFSNEIRHTSKIIMSTMKAIRFHGNQDLRLDEVPVAKVGPDQVKIAPEWCGLCGSGWAIPRQVLTVDLHEYLEGPHYSPRGPHPITKEDLPRTFGHEFAGIPSFLGI